MNTKNEIRKEAFERGLENGILRDFLNVVHSRTQHVPEMSAVNQLASALIAQFGEVAAPHTLPLILRLRDELNVLDGMLQAHGFPEAGNGTVRSMIAAAFATLTGAAFCSHDWKDIRNKIITSGEACFKCGSLRAGNQTTDTQKTT